jgi:putative spermidine/putrescine transport system permease protein
MILRATVTAIYIYLLAPVVIVCVIAFSASTTYAFPPPQWSLRWFRAFFANQEFLSSLIVSLQLAVASSAASIVLGTAAAIGLKESRLRASQAIEVFFMSPLFIPRILVGVLLFLLLLPLGLQGSFTGLFLAHLLIVTPYTVRTLLASLHGIDPAITEAARTMGAGRLRALVEVTLPLIKTGILGGLLFAFSVSFTDFYVALFLTSHQTMTLPMQMFYYLEWQQDPVVAAAATIQIALIMIIGLVADRVAGLGRMVGRG